METLPKNPAFKAMKHELLRQLNCYPLDVLIDAINTNTQSEKNNYTRREIYKYFFDYFLDDDPSKLDILIPSLDIATMLGLIEDKYLFPRLRKLYLSSSKYPPSKEIRQYNVEQLTTLFKLYQFAIGSAKGNKDKLIVKFIRVLEYIGHVEEQKYEDIFKFAPEEPSPVVILKEEPEENPAQLDLYINRKVLLPEQVK